MSKFFVTVPLPSSFWWGICTIFGIITAFYSMYALTSFAIICIIIFISINRMQLLANKRFFCACMMLACFCAGFIRYNQLTARYNKQYKELIQGPFSLRGTVIDRFVKTTNRFKTVLKIKISEIMHTTCFFPFNATILLYVHKCPDVLLGDYILLRSLVCKPQKNSFQQHLYREGVIASLFAQTVSATIIKRSKNDIKRYVAQARTRVMQALSAKLSKPTLSCLRSLFFGITDKNDPYYQQLRKQCSYWGIVHYLARSGLHVVLIAGALNCVIKYIPIHFFIRQLFLLIIIIIYHLFTWSSISFMRAFISFILYKLLILHSLSFQMIHIISLTTLIVLIHNPLQFFFLDFQLSFALTLALSWFNEVSLQARLKNSKKTRQSIL